MINVTNVVRMTALGAFVVVVISATVGWFLGLDTGRIVPLVGTIVVAMGVGEGSNVGKRMSWKKEAAEQ